MAASDNLDNGSPEEVTLDSIFRSDMLPQLLKLASALQLFELIKGIIQLQFVIDAQIVQQELRWRLRRRQKAEARTSLHEAIVAGVVVAFAPPYLDFEIEKHVPRIAKASGRNEDDVRSEYQNVRGLLRFHTPRGVPRLDCPIADPNDLDYVATAGELGVPVYSMDPHFRQMGTPVICITIDAPLRTYARTSTVRVAVTMGTTFSVILSLQAIAAGCRGLKHAARWFGRLHPLIQIGIVAAGIVAIAHPKSRAKLQSLMQWLKSAAGPAVVKEVQRVAVQFAEAGSCEAEARRALMSAMPPQRRSTALVHIRAACLAAGVPLAESEIEQQVRARGYVTRSRSFPRYLRRVIVASREFAEVAPGRWSLKTATPSAGPSAPKPDPAG